MENQTLQPKAKRNLILPIVLGIVIIGGAIFGVKEYMYYQHNADTDDAHIDADISPVIARVPGYIQSVRFADNQRVKAGDTLAVIDGRDFQVKLSQAQAALQSAGAGIAVNKASVATAEASVETAKANITAAEAKFVKADNDFKRTEPLLISGAATQQQLDGIKAERDASAAGLQAAKAQLVVTERQVETAKDQVDATITSLVVKNTDIDFANLQLSYIYLIAPATGIVNKRTIQSGQLVQPGQTLVSVLNDSNLYVTANFKETQLERMKIGQTVDLEVDAFPDKTFEGTIASFSPGTGSEFSMLPADNASGNFVKVVQRIPVKIAIKKGPSSELLKAGMNVKAVVHLD